MEKLSLKVKLRSALGNKNNALRRQGLVPGVLYGRKIENKNLIMNTAEFGKVYRQAGESTLIDLELEDGQTQKVLIQDLQIDPLTNKVTHVDFRGIDMSEKLEVKIPLKFIGESPAVRELSGILVKAMGELEVRCLPQALVHEIVVDLSSLATIGANLRVKDLKLPAGLEVMQKEDAVVVTVTEPRSEEEMAALEEKPEMKVEEVKVVEKEKKEKEEEEPAAK